MVSMIVIHRSVSLSNRGGGGGGGGEGMKISTNIISSLGGSPVHFTHRQPIISKPDTVYFFSFCFGYYFLQRQFAVYKFSTQYYILHESSTWKWKCLMPAAPHSYIHVHVHVYSYTISYTRILRTWYLLVTYNETSV